MAAKTENDATSPTLDILQPEVMSREELIATLQQKNVDQCDIGSLEKERLIELYYKSVLPMPQRKYRLNRRGQVATKHQVVMGKSRKRTFEKIYVADSTTDSSSQSKGLITSFRLPPSTPPVDRLKPPPVNTDRKIIRLNSKSPDSSMSGIVIKDMTATKSPNGSSTVQSSPSTGSVTKSSPETTTPKSKSFKVNRVTFSPEEPTTTSTKVQKSPQSSMDISPEVKTKQPKLPSSRSSPDTSAEEVVRKKFKTASITWP